MLTIPNIYRHKNAKYLILLPLALFVISLFLSRYLVLDPTLVGGATIVLQSNSTIAPQQIASSISSAIHGSSPTVEAGSGTIQITMDLNTSLAAAETRLNGVGSWESNYSNYFLNFTSYQIALQADPSNSTAASALNTSKAGMSKSLANMQSSFSAEMSSLKPFGVLPNASVNVSNVSSILQAAQDAYSKAQIIYQNQVMSTVNSIVPYSSYSFEYIGPELSSYFLSQLQSIIIIAFILVSIVVLFIFRSPIPSFAVVFGAANDIIVAIGAMALFGIPLGITSIGGLLMLIGYSIDTDVLTAIRILKRSGGTPEDRAYESMKTGLTMTATAIVAFAVLFVVSIIIYVPTYYEISSVVLFGLIADIFTTWFGNASIILWHKKRKEGI
ncbi:hypothetical protein M1394_01825 [Candidatus Marsarchaeota archaeon]|nr:hypothetical protein [Candidatus Marsarchaeota archaeon]